MRYYQKNERPFVFDIKWKGMSVGNKRCINRGKTIALPGVTSRWGPEVGLFPIRATQQYSRVIVCLQPKRLDAGGKRHVRDSGES